MDAMDEQESKAQDEAELQSFAEAEYETRRAEAIAEAADEATNDEAPVSGEMAGMPGISNMILPTGSCFDDALDFLEGLAKEHNPILRTGRLLLVHAICLAPDGHEYSHAWVEQDEKFVIFRGIWLGVKNYFAASIDEYYRDAKVKDTTKYTPQQACIENHNSGNYGPWVERYKKLCGKGEIS